MLLLSLFIKQYTFSNLILSLDALMSLLSTARIAKKASGVVLLSYLSYLFFYYVTIKCTDYAQVYLKDGGVSGGT